MSELNETRAETLARREREHLLAKRKVALDAAVALHRQPAADYGPPDAEQVLQTADAFVGWLQR